ncbi:MULTISPECIES: family 1 glycosylhydrolase [Novosphingobium]|uniref:Beta-glucosidase n=1 Tax=Novosphingobium mathurense TaxID=428990 RepID=A0A1U6IMK3_9SPHN|nr:MULTISPECIES: family 1 glycosylhydrolase [Novosphingobium]CDO37957.1 Glycoside hydrolase, family 1 [Novosphingobium sp. KN65.2]SLK09259.1 beta-glucosidase [Novosphingobium mathurense]
MIDRRSLIASAAALGATAAIDGTALARAAKPRPVDPHFPQGFLWGAATAAHQVEGNNLNADLWVIENVPGTIFADRSGDAANSLELWPVDLDLVKGMGLNSYRFSLEWARIEPDEGYFSNAMLDHYKAMIDGCRARGLNPVVTFNHFTTPRWFAAKGGWHNPESPALFARFCERAARHLAEGIALATTLNEPNLAGVIGEILPPELLAGDRATQEMAAKQLGVPLYTPGVTLYVKDPKTYRANMMEAHRRGTAAIKAVRSDLDVGVSLAILDDQAIGKHSMRDTIRERYYGEWLRLAARTCDFIGVQNYERKVWNDKGALPPPADARLNAGGAEVWAGSLAGAVSYAWEATKLPVYVTEHGVNSDDDGLRQWLIPAALTELKRVMDSGVPVRGYFHWSLIDNFEWGFGYHHRFGLHSFDRETFERTAKPSAAVLGAIAQSNSLS